MKLPTLLTIALLLAAGCGKPPDGPKPVWNEKSGWECPDGYEPTFYYGMFGKEEITCQTREAAHQKRMEYERMLKPVGNPEVQK